jgi:hypothetical protein
MDSCTLGKYPYNEGLVYGGLKVSYSRAEEGTLVAPDMSGTHHRSSKVLFLSRTDLECKEGIRNKAVRLSYSM